jgi:hypothetical protein
MTRVGSAFIDLRGLAGRASPAAPRRPRLAGRAECAKHVAVAAQFPERVFAIVILQGLPGHIAMAPAVFPNRVTLHTRIRT